VTFTFTFFTHFGGKRVAGETPEEWWFYFLHEKRKTSPLTRQKVSEKQCDIALSTLP
jgi:hypothetical protein